MAYPKGCQWAEKIGGGRGVGDEKGARPCAAQSTPRAGETLIALMWTKRRRQLGGERRLVSEPVYRLLIDGQDDWPAHNRMPHKRGFAKQIVCRLTDDNKGLW